MTRNWLKSSRSYPVLTVALPSYLFPPDRIILADIDRAAEFPSFPEIGKVCRRNSIGVALRTAGIRIRTVGGRRREGSREPRLGAGGRPTKRQVRCSWRLSYFITFAFEPHCSSVCFVSGFNLDTGPPPFAMLPLPLFPSRSLSPEWRANEVGTLSFSVSLSYPDALNAAARSAPIFISREGWGGRGRRMHRGRSRE